MSEAIDPNEFRKVMGEVPTCVTVVTGLVEEQPVAMVIGSFVSISLEPPMAGFFATTTSGSWLALKEAPVFGVNVLAANQADVSGAFMRPPEERFTEIDWSDAGGAPRIAGCAAWMTMTESSTTLAGDHDFWLGEITHLEGSDPMVDPLVFHRGAYRELG